VLTLYHWGGYTSDSGSEQINIYTLLSPKAQAMWDYGLHLLQSVNSSYLLRFSMNFKTINIKLAHLKPMNKMVLLIFENDGSKTPNFRENQRNP
jgi:hypothetical protein